MSVLMAKRQVERAHIIVIMIDATDHLASQDASIAGIAQDAFRPVIVVVNKWDLVPEKRTETHQEFESRIRQ